MTSATIPSQSARGPAWRQERSIGRGAKEEDAWRARALRRGTDESSRRQRRKCHVVRNAPIREHTRRSPYNTLSCANFPCLFCLIRPETASSLLTDDTACEPVRFALTPIISSSQVVPRLSIPTGDRTVNNRQFAPPSCSFVRPRFRAQRWFYHLSPFVELMGVDSPSALQLRPLLPPFYTFLSCLSPCC